MKITKTLPFVLALGLTACFVGADEVVQNKAQAEPDATEPNVAHPGKQDKELAGDWRIPEEKAKFHIFMLMGQSNMAGGMKPRDAGHLLPEDNIPVPHVLMIPTYKNLAKPYWKPAAHPLHVRNRRPNSFGLGLPFAKKYLEKNPGVTVGLIPLAFGGHNIDKLRKGSKVYADGIMKAEFAVQFGTIKGVLWHQGESDRGDESSRVYEEKLHGLIADLRKDLNSEKLPFIVGNLAEFVSPGHEGTERVKAILRSLPEEVPYTGFVESTGLKHSSGAHFDRESYIELGQRYCDALLQVMNETVPR